MKNILLKSHKKAREFKEKYDVDYHFQVSLFLQYYLKSSENQVELDGSGRLKSWAAEIREEMLSKFNDLESRNKINNIPNSDFFINYRELDIEKLKIILEQEYY